MAPAALALLLNSDSCLLAPDVQGPVAPEGEARHHPEYPEQIKLFVFCSLLSSHWGGALCTVQPYFENKFGRSYFRSSSSLWKAGASRRSRPATSRTLSICSFGSCSLVFTCLK
jgi:hypothetical protein